MENINENLVSAIFDVGRHIKQELLESKCLEDFSQTEIEILKFVNLKKRLTMKSIADHLCIKPSSATAAVDRLVGKGSLKRVQDKNDRRIVYVEFTAKGLSSLEKKYKKIRKAIQSIFGSLSEKDKKNLIKIFEKIYGKNE